MVFWGVEVEPEKPFTHSHHKSLGRLRITQATLAPRAHNAKGFVECRVGKKKPVLICGLSSSDLQSCHLELEFDEFEIVTFNVIGSRFSIHLSGYYVNIVPTLDEIDQSRHPAGLASPKGAQCDAHQFDRKMDELLSDEGNDFFTSHDEVYDRFDAMCLKENLLRGIYAYGFKKPSAIQQRGIVPFCQGLDVIMQAQQGDRRTSTFCSGILQQLDYDLLECQALVLAPTRELAQQIEKIMRALGAYLGVKVHACVGTSLDEYQSVLPAGVHVVVGTVQHVSDILCRESFPSNHIKILVLDDVDELLSCGFLDQICDIFQLLPPKIQVGVFSTIMPSEALKITEFMNEPVRILLRCDEFIPKRIKQFYVNGYNATWKLETLCDLYKTLPVTQSVIIVNTRNTERMVDWLSGRMRDLGHTISSTHEGMDQNARDVNMREFQTGHSRMLITTGRLAHGINVQPVSLVINYDLPSTPEDYRRMIGISGRFGKKGVAISFVTRDEKRMLSDIQKFYNIVIDELPADIADLF